MSYPYRHRPWQELATLALLAGIVGLAVACGLYFMITGGWK